jgi:exonuclease VII large subunit
MKQANEIVSKQELKVMQKHLAQTEARISEMDRLYIKTYEDNANGKLFDKRFKMLSEQYDSEQEDLKAKAIQLKKRIETQEQNTESVDKFVSLIKAHFEDDGLNGYNLHELIQGIYIENADMPNDTDGNIEIDDDDGECIIYSKKPKLSTSKKYRIRKIHIKYDFVGFIPVNKLLQYAEESKNAQDKEISA